MSLLRRVLTSSRHHPFVTAFVVVLVLLVGAVDVRLFVVPTSDRPGPTDAVVVLGGGTFFIRLRTAIKLVDTHPGTALIVSTPGNTQCPRHLRDRAQVICFRPDPSTTQGEARAATQIGEEHGWRSLTVVTTADQVWRARLRFSRCWPGDLRVVQASTSEWVRLSSVVYEMGATVKAEVFQRSC
jgi:uncharacterized SAM-binding protein YcdF (DUF218 family)